MILSRCQMLHRYPLVMPLKYVTIQGHNVQTFLPVGMTKKSVSQRIISSQGRKILIRSLYMWRNSSLSSDLIKTCLVKFCCCYFFV